YFFFFSSRRRHTRFSRDWSSDVCSSDLGPVDRGARTLDRVAQGLGDGRHLQGRAHRERIVLAVAGLTQLAIDGLDREPRGRPASRVATHAVGDDIDLKLLVDEEAVFVVVPSAADIRHAD